MISTISQDRLKKYLKPGYPKKGVSAGTFRTELAYVGDYNSLEVGAPAIGDAWANYEGTVEDVQLEPIGGTDPLMGELFVNMTREYGTADSGGSEGGAGTVAEVNYEVDWTVVNRPLIEHPAFTAAPYKLSDKDYKDIEKWEGDKTDKNFLALSAYAAKYADGIRQGITSYDDLAPVISRTTAYVNGPPPRSSAGAKDQPPTDFPNGPVGYEWLKSADRSLKAGKKNRWERVEQWTGAKRILVDKNRIYY